MKNRINLFHNTTWLKAIFFCLLMVYGADLYAQNTIQGVVIDSSGETIIGANVTVKGTTLGTLTDIDGKFTLNAAPTSGTLEVSYVGYIKQSIPISGKRMFQITLKEDTELLDEVVVVGYGVVKKPT
ncbi:carboxypeptidase-like regulatory domain-containing protein [Bacteroides propionicifaciens]|jgi:TonB-dependent starch-binding outer membrane protein SusC|uniref:carboxypeptidase-like regulatory domain-containing protein n=1 Tax=Bacteroides propionicifaciens TaxID=392838 RepID=UPI0006877D8B|nr:carboxypeptidase-like regulatory domain-containing protein [Bacteroides propionicifaciens]